MDRFFDNICATTGRYSNCSGETLASLIADDSVFYSKHAAIGGTGSLQFPLPVFQPQQQNEFEINLKEQSEDLISVK